MYTLSVSPHIHSNLSVKNIMWDVIIALVPALCMGIYFFGTQALYPVVVSVLTAVITEGIISRIRRLKTISNGSAIVTGLLLAMIIPPGVPLWLPAVGSACAVILGKEVFGGLGRNIFNPALIGRAILMASWPTFMTTWMEPKLSLFGRIDTITSATPLAIVKLNLSQELPSYWSLFIGNVGGSIGETSALALLLGAIFLFIRKRISWHIPVSYIGCVALLSWIFGRNGLFTGDALFSILSGGLILGAFFMATDYVTTPITPKGKIIFGLGAGIIVVLIRLKGGYPEGVCYSILLMNAVTPLIDRWKWTIPKKFGEINA
ncbi:RnfABCDGE type electron transport complex subunit D [bacterium]|nr:RnfABCDGE type electron transport complex subunit D [bacterium]